MNPLVLRHLETWDCDNDDYDNDNDTPQPKATAEIENTYVPIDFSDRCRHESRLDIYISAH